MKTNEITNKPKEIKAEISFEVIGEDEPTKYAKRRECWATVSVCFLIAFALIFIACMIFGMTLEDDIYFHTSLYMVFNIALGITLIGFIVSLCKSGDTYPEEGYSSFPYEGGF